MKRLHSLSGMTLVEVLVVFGISALLALVGVELLSMQMKTSTRTQITASRDRILAGIRSLAGNPAALRNSMQALTSDGISPANPDLLACVGGNPVNACTNGKKYDLYLYSPLVNMVAGIVNGVKLVATPSDSPTPIHFNSLGSPCLPNDALCPFVVTVFFEAECAPLPLTQVQLSGPIRPSWLQPQGQCTVADTIQVTYTVQVDPAMLATDPRLTALAGSLSGSVSTHVALISGNLPE